jgi:hypothetical protein
VTQKRRPIELVFLGALADIQDLAKSFRVDDNVRNLSHFQDCRLPQERAQILAAIEEPGAVVAEVARRADVCTSLVYKWRREARSAVSASSFARRSRHWQASPSLARFWWK